MPNPPTDPAASRARSRQAGVTLVELLVVLVILGLVAGLVGPQVMGYLADAKRDTARIQIDRLGGVLDLYRLDVGRYPDRLDALVTPQSGADGWRGPYVEKAERLRDPWRNPYRYRHPGEHGAFDLYSLGADGEPGGTGANADVTSW